MKNQQNMRSERDIAIKEIGSEFWNTPLKASENGLFESGVQWFCSGRSALQSICRELRGYKSVAMPSWCCDSMIKPFLDSGIDVSFYPVYWRNGIVQEIDYSKDILFLMDYFGFSCEEKDTRSYRGIIIRDITHSLFNCSYKDSDYYFGSLRKWAGIKTGGFAWATKGNSLQSAPCFSELGLEYVSLREKAMIEKEHYIASHELSDKRFLSMFNAAEECLETIGIEPALDQDIEYAKKMDESFIRNSRRSNAKVLMESFHNWLVFPNSSSEDCPMFVPILVPDDKRDTLRRKLIENSIYCPIHWPISKYHRLDEKTKEIYYRELSLVCDQRYSISDMNRIVDTIVSLWKRI